MTNHVELIRAYVESYRCSRDAPGFDACVEAEINQNIDGLLEIIAEHERKTP